MESYTATLSANTFLALCLLVSLLSQNTSVKEKWPGVHCVELRNRNGQRNASGVSGYWAELIFAMSAVLLPHAGWAEWDLLRLGRFCRFSKEKRSVISKFTNNTWQLGPILRHRRGHDAFDAT